VKRNDLVLGGMTPLSTLDFPDRLSAVLYAQGCPLRCRYCHNPELWPMRATMPQASAPLAWPDAVAWLHRRCGLLDGVVFSGGEATAQPALMDALKQVREMGFQTALHTAGIYPQRLKAILPLLDWVGFDIKAPFDRYADVTGVPGSGDKAHRSLTAVLSSGVEYELRTTVHSHLLAADDLLDMAKTLQSCGVHRWVLQEFRTQGCADAELSKMPSKLDAALVSRLREWVPETSIRAVGSWPGVM
jgi:pyruvate formate lyase activating enzyme